MLIAPAITAEARALFAAKQNVRLLEVPISHGGNALDFKRVGGGVLLQSADDRNVQRAELRVVTRKQPTAQQLDDLMFAWKVAKFVKSNAIVFCAGGMTLGVGAGQMSRVDCVDASRRSRPPTPGCRCRARRWPATRSFRFATGWTWWSTPAPPA